MNREDGKAKMGRRLCGPRGSLQRVRRERGSAPASSIVVEPVSPQAEVEAEALRVAILRINGSIVVVAVACPG